MVIDPHQAQRSAQRRHRNAVLVDGEGVGFRRAKLGEQDAQAGGISARRDALPYPVEPETEKRRPHGRSAYFGELASHPDRIVRVSSPSFLSKTARSARTMRSMSGSRAA